MSTSLVTPDLVNKAVQLVLPYARNMCEQFPWEGGPTGVVFVVDGEALAEPFVYQMEELGPRESWKPNYGYDFLQIANQKAEISLLTGRPSLDVLANSPWRLYQGNSIYAGAVAEDTSLVVAVSGSHEWVDVCIAWCLFTTIAGLCAKQVELARAIHEDTL